MHKAREMAGNFLQKEQKTKVTSLQIWPFITKEGSNVSKASIYLKSSKRLIIKTKAVPIIKYFVKF